MIGDWLPYMRQLCGESDFYFPSCSGDSCSYIYLHCHNVEMQAVIRGPLCKVLYTQFVKTASTSETLQSKQGNSRSPEGKQKLVRFPRENQKVFGKPSLGGILDQTEILMLSFQ